MVLILPVFILTLIFSAFAAPVPEGPTRRTANRPARRCAAQATALVGTTTTTHHSTTTTKSSSTATNKVSSSVSSPEGSVDAIFPVAIADTKSHWTTDASISGHLPLDDSTLNIIDDISSLPHPYVSWEGKTAIQSYFPKGSVDPASSSKGGISFYSEGPISFAGATEATFSYSIYFEEGFDWNLAGKLPGLFGGSSTTAALGCSGGDARDDCFSLRMMWRPDGKGEVYTYLPPSAASYNNGILKKVPPESILNSDYGNSVGRGAFTFPTGEWITIAQRVVLNDVGQKNGIVQIYVNGKSVIDVSELELRVESSVTFRGGQFQCFFGGHGSQYASPKDQSLWLADISGAVVS